jgi:DNA (cytosine-5)-methyltransferase 1
MKGLSLFSSAGIAEMMLKNLGIDIVIANELLPIRAKTYQYWHPGTNMICGDITLSSTKKDILNAAKKEKIDFMLITPPCQGVSLIGKNKNNEQMLRDNRNYLLFDALEIVDAIRPN